MAAAPEMPSEEPLAGPSEEPSGELSGEPSGKPSEIQVKGEGVQLRKNVYILDPEQRGACLIINNMEFSNKQIWPIRTGSDNDERRFKKLFEDKFQFTVSVVRNRTVEEMKADIATTVEKDNIGDKNCFVLIILSHGIQGAICGKDSPNPEGLKTGGSNLTKDGESEPDKFLAYKTIVELLSNENCEALKHKPKICFFQACGGKRIPEYQSDGNETDLPEEVTLERIKLRLPPASDILLSFAAQDDFKAYRAVEEANKNDNGGIYAKYLYDTLVEDAKSCDLEDMLKTVERKMRQKVASAPDSDKKICMSTSVKLIGWSNYFYFYQQDKPSTTETKLWVLGGDELPEVLPDIGKPWTVVENSGLERGHEVVANSSNDSVYVFDEDCNILSWKWKENVVEPITQICPKMRDFAHAVLDGHIYIIGGKIENSDVQLCKVYNTKNNEWTKIPNTVTTSDTSTAIVLNDKIYLGFPYTLHVYNPVHSEWTHKYLSGVKNVMETIRNAYGMATCGKYIWVFGGFSSAGELLRDVERYWPTNGEWRTMKPMPTARSDLSVSFFRGKFYAIGGTDENNECLDTVEIYDPKTDEWSPGLSITKPRALFSSVVL